MAGGLPGDRTREAGGAHHGARCAELSAVLASQSARTALVALHFGDSSTARVTDTCILTSQNIPIQESWGRRTHRAVHRPASSASQEPVRPALSQVLPDLPDQKLSGRTP